MKLFPTPMPPTAMAHGGGLVLAQLQAQMAQPHMRASPLGLPTSPITMWRTPLRCCAIWVNNCPRWPIGAVPWVWAAAGNNVGVLRRTCAVDHVVDLPPEQYRVFSVWRHYLWASAFPHTRPWCADGHAPRPGRVAGGNGGRTSSGYLFSGVAASRGASLALRRHAGGDGAAWSAVGGLSGVAFSDQVGLVSRNHAGLLFHWPTSRRDPGAGQRGAAPGWPARAGRCCRLWVWSSMSDPQPALRAVRHTLAGLSNADAPALQGTGHFVPIRACAISSGWMWRAVACAGDRKWACTRVLASVTWRPRADLTRICAEIREELAPESLGAAG